ncbi:MAG TPA: EAL domain-containing protein, partial [Baekduia sp.]
GAGFGSFHYLKNLPFDELKIDGQFIRNLTTNPDDLVLVETLVQLARGLGKRTVAEYVEDAAVVQLLRDVGVDYAQGYYIGAPMPAPELLGIGRRHDAHER